MLLSFAWTTGALLSGNKTVTRRDWSEDHVKHFHVGDVVDAWDRLPRVKDARRIGAIRLTADPEPQSSALTTAEDFFAEGFRWLQSYGTIADVERVSRIWTEWHEKPEQLYVVRFALVSTICPNCSAVVPGPLGHTAGISGPLFRCCGQCALNRYGCRCALGEPSVAKRAYDLDDDAIRRLEEALDR